jgi:hypothetical protein
MAATIDKVRELFEEGGTVTCIENTYRTELNGSTRRIDKLGKSYADCTPLTGPDVGKGGFYMALPTRAKDVVAVTDTEATWKIGRDEHTVTIRKGSA